MASCACCVTVFGQSLPKLAALQAQVDFTLQRTQRGLAVDFHELSPVLRLWHDKPATSAIDNDTLAIAAASGVRLE